MSKSHTAQIAARSGKPHIAAALYREIAEHAKMARKPQKADFYSKLADEYGAMKIINPTHYE